MDNTPCEVVTKEDDIRSNCEVLTKEDDIRSIFQDWNGQYTLWRFD